MLLVRWGKSDGAVIDESLKAAAVPIGPNQLLSQREEGDLECRRTVLANGWLSWALW